MPRDKISETIASLFGNLRNDYEAAKKTRFKRTRKGVSLSGSHADYHYRTWQDYARIMETARDLFRNHQLLAQGIRRLCANVFRGGFQLDANTGDKALDLELSARWREYSSSPDMVDAAGEQTFNGLAEHVLRHVIVDGDILALPLTNGSIQLIEGHRLRTPSNTRRNVVHGVLLDDKRRRLEYWVTKEDVNPFASVARVADVEQFPTRMVDDVTGQLHRSAWHMYMPDRVSQTRGVTALVPIVDTAGMTDDLLFAQLVKAQMAACITIFREIAASVQNVPALGGEGMKTTSETRPDGTTRTVAGYQPGLEMFGYPGETLKGFSPNVPNQEFFSHANLLLTIVAVNLDLPVAVLLLDPSQTNFSGWRGAIDQARQRFQVLQQWLIRSLHTPVYEWKVRHWARQDNALRRIVEASIRNRRLRNGGVDAFAHRWHAQEWAYIEPTQDALGDVIQERNLLISPRRRAARRGMDYEDLTSEIMADRAMVIVKAHDTATELNRRLGLSLTWHDVAHWPMPDGIQVSMQTRDVSETVTQQQAEAAPTNRISSNGANGHAN